MNTGLIEFDVIDRLTGEKPDLKAIALNEEWAKHLMYCDMDGFVIGADGSLALIDDCGSLAYPPNPARFEVRWKNLVPQSQFVIANTPEAARVFLLCQSCIYFSDIKEARRVRAELAAVDPDFVNAKIYQLVTGVVEVE